MKATSPKTPKKSSQKPVNQFHWGIALLLGFIIGASLILQTNQAMVAKPKTAAIHPIDDDIAGRIKAIETNYPNLAQPPHQTWSVLPVNVISMRYLLLKDAAWSKNELPYFEQAMAAITASKNPTKPVSRSAPVSPQIVGISVPILMYHRTPNDFEQQISYLVSHGYTAIGFGELVAAIKNKSPLPAKPVIITLDDGYADQLQEIAILRRYSMKATLYIINGGESSRWCIGANAKGLPGCEAYLNWDQIRQLDREGLITIGSHTINHPNLPTLSYDQQRAEIAGGKQELERQLGHAVYDFAYPYGAFNSSSVRIAQQVGFREAVSTIPGTIHNQSTLFTLHRVRDSLELP